MPINARRMVRSMAKAALCILGLLLLGVVVLILSYFGPALMPGLIGGRAPDRSFGPEELFVGDEVMPSGWYSTYQRPIGYGDDMRTSESHEKGFVTTVDGDPDGRARQSIYRYKNWRVARYIYDEMYLTETRLSATAKDWLYQSNAARRWHVSCENAGDGSGYLVCKFGGLYEEYILTFQMWLVPGESSLADMEKIVEVIDLRIAEYLALEAASN